MTGFLHEKDFSRKTFLKGGGALVVGFSFLGAGLTPGRAQAANLPNIAPDITQVDSWLTINADSTVTLYPGHHEFGQGTWTGYRQIAAEELDVPVTTISIPQFDTASAHPFPNQGSTAGSNGTANGGPVLRQAAAEARRALMTLAAAQLGVPASSLTVSQGIVSSGGKTVSYGSLVGGKLFNTTIGTGNNLAPLKPVSQYTVVGTRVPRFDIPAKVTGAFTYLQNVRIPGMVHGRPVRPRGQANVLAAAPEGGYANYKVLSVDESSIAHIPNVQVVRKGDFVGVVAPKEFDAIQAAAQLKVVWSASNTLPGSGNLPSATKAAPTITPDSVVLSYGNVDSALASAAHTLAATYTWPYQMHSPLGPCCAIADVTSGGRVTLFAQQQDGWGYQSAVTQVTGIPAQNIRVLIFEGASTFNPSPNVPVIADAAVMSQVVGKPVRVQYMRWDMHGWEPYGPANVADIQAGLDASGKLVALKHTSWYENGANVTPAAAQIGVTVPVDTLSSRASVRGAPSRLAPTTNNANAVGGTRFETFTAGDQFFPNVPNRQTISKTIASRFSTSALRGPGVIQPAWAFGTAMDELAHAANMDAVAFLQAHTTHDAWRPLLDATAKLANWQTRVSASKLSAGRYVTGRGIAFGGENHAFSDVYSGVAAEVRVDRKSGKVVVQHLYGAQDSGFIVNPASAENQMVGMLTRGASRTLFEEITFSKQRVTALDWVTYPILRFKDHPDVTTLVIPHQDEVITGDLSPAGTYPGPRYRGVGESLETVVPPAIGNAIFDATGVRLREAPLTPAKVLAALKQAGRHF
ncbi:MAG TPA: molybdopterin cofactor-binding domain-containing protein [Gaiellaceae bacterium]|jgi:CO/xanthine dehydrogenase Mo-binding subunit|nr:molybdopterin cofactor-binding domain-containing protein [Gaiellaceae bacterium]